MEEEIERCTTRLKEALQHVFRITNIIFDTYQDDSGDKQINQMRDILIKLLISEETLKNFAASVQKKTSEIQKCFEENRNSLRDDYFAETVKSVLQSSMVNEKKFKKKLISNESYQKFEAEIANNFTMKNQARKLSESRQNDLSVTHFNHIIHDPFTKQIMKRPVKNIHCGHSYDYKSIITFINKKENIKCPYAGCTNIHPLKIKDLIENLQLQNYIKQYENEKNQK